MSRTIESIQDELLVLRCQDGEVAALEQLIGRWYPRLLGHAMRLTGEREAAQDATQEAWMAIVKGIRRLNDPAGFPAWAYRIVSHKCADWIRQRQRRRGLQQTVAHESASANSQLLSEQNDIERLRSAIGRLAPEHQVVVHLHYREGLSVADIARSLKVPVGTVKSRLHHARNQLKQSLERIKS